MLLGVIFPFRPWLLSVLTGCSVCFVPECHLFKYLIYIYSMCLKMHSSTCTHTHRHTHTYTQFPCLLWCWLVVVANRTFLFLELRPPPAMSTFPLIIPSSHLLTLTFTSPHTHKHTHAFKPFSWGQSFPVCIIFDNDHLPALCPNLPPRPSLIYRTLREMIILTVCMSRVAVLQASVCSGSGLL